jgi:hypothetical protein
MGDYRVLENDCPHLQLPDPGFGFLGLQHERAWFRLGSNAWVVADLLKGRGVHRCTSLIHFYPTFEIAQGGERIMALSLACSIAVIPLGSPEPQVSITRGDHPKFPGWYSPEFGVKFPGAVLGLHWAKAQLPWIGGALITSAVNEPFRQMDIAPGEGRLRLEFSGSIYDLKMK